MTMNAADYLKTVELDGEHYTIAMASAVQQRSVMFKPGKYGLEPAIRNIALAQVGEQSVDVIYLGIVATMMYRIPEEDFNFIADTMLQKVRKQGHQHPITINDFTGKMQNYTKLVLLALGVNFADFSQFLTLFQKSIEAAPDQEQASETSTQESTGSSGDLAPDSTTAVAE